MPTLRSISSSIDLPAAASAAESSASGLGWSAVAMKRTSGYFWRKRTARPMLGRRGCRQGKCPWPPPEPASRLPRAWPPCVWRSLVEFDAGDLRDFVSLAMRAQAARRPGDPHEMIEVRVEQLAEQEPTREKNLARVVDTVTRVHGGLSRRRGGDVTHRLGGDAIVCGDYGTTPPGLQWTPW